MALDAKTFFEVVQKHGLVSEKKFLALKNAIKKESLSQSDLDSIVAKKYLTKWQATRLVAGKYNFSVGDFLLLDFLGKDDFGEVYLVRPKDRKVVYRLRLVAKEVSSDPARIQPYLSRVQAFQAIKNPRLTRVVQAAEVGGRHFVVTERPVGDSCAKALHGLPQASDTVQKMVDDIAEVLGGLEMADVQHGSIDQHTVLVTDEKEWNLDLPTDIGYSSNNVAAQTSSSDAACLAKLAGGLLVGDFDQQDTDQQNTTGSEVANSLASLAAKPDAQLAELKSAFVSVAIPAIPDLAPALDESAPAVTADALESIDKQEDVFGSFDQVEVVSEIQAPKPVPANMPVVVDNQAAVATTPAKPGAEKDEANEKVIAPADNKKILLFAAVGGGVGVVVLGLLIFFLTRGNDSGDQRVADNQANEKNADAGKKDDPESDPAADDNTPESVKKKEMQSSGMFKGIGAFNKKEADTKSPPKKGSNETAPKPTADKGKQGIPNNANNPNASDDKAKQPTKKGGLDPSKGNAPGVAKDKNKSPTKSNPDLNQKDNEATLPGIGGEKVAKKDPGEDGKTKQKEKEDPEEAVLLIGQSKKDKSKKETGGQSGKLANPFTKSPDFVSLTLPKKGSDITAFQSLFPLNIPPSLPLVVTLHGGDNASKSKIKFELKASTSENAKWVVSAGSKAPFKPIGHFHFDGQNFGFAWETAAADFSNSVFLTNCAIRIQASEFKHEMALRAPAITEPLDFSKSLSAKGNAVVTNLPNIDNIRVVMVNLPKNFPPYETVPANKKNQLKDMSLLVFKNENIDRVKAEFLPTIRGTKVMLNLALNYVSPDKQNQKLTTLKKFNQEYEAFIANADALQKQSTELNKTWAAMKDENAKRQFTIQKNRTQIEKDAKAAVNLKKHLQKTSEIVNGIAKNKIQFRVYYQAGEIEVDLATPDGKKYTPPRPAAPKNAKAKGAKAKKK